MNSHGARGEHRSTVSECLWTCGSPHRTSGPHFSAGLNSTSLAGRDLQDTSSLGRKAGLGKRGCVVEAIDDAESAAGDLHVRVLHTKRPVSTCGDVTTDSNDNWLGTSA